MRSLTLVGLMMMVPAVGSCAGGDRAIEIGPAPTDGSADGSADGSSNNDAGGMADGSPDATMPEDICVDEVCGDGLDNDCDGIIDNGCYCIPGELVACFGGPVSSRGVGACQDGEMVCADGAEFGVWGECEGDVLPAEEICDVARIDEDCDGAANEGCECADDEVVDCGSDIGECVAGMQVCTDGRFGDCIGAVGPSVETCNGLDDDCDGTNDEGLVRSCGIDVGECRMGMQACIDGEWETRCLGSRAPSDEICDERDNDCDSRVDEDLNRPCGSSVGECGMGAQSCISGAWSMCVGSTGPMLEDCNGLDDDCDGPIDESLSRRCGIDTGICRSGAEACGGGAWGACMGDIGPGSELCDGILDEDCDGLVDEGCGCVTGSIRSCGSAVGECAAGRETCDAAGRWGLCTGSTGPSAELCNARDDDCDTRTDEGLNRACGSDVGICTRGMETCARGGWGACLGATTARAEACDGVFDEDCDGRVDEGCSCVTGRTRGCGSAVGECRAGTETCDATGSWGSCLGFAGPAAESCDARDNDCDMTTDEGLARGCGSDTGICRRGSSTCAAGAWGRLCR